MKLRIYFTIVISFCYCLLSAQNTGFMGRHFITKTDVVYLIGSSLDFQVEYAFHRDWSATLNYTKQNVKPSLNSISQLSTQARELKFGVRHYLTPEQASLSGGYHFANLGYGIFNSSSLLIDSTYSVDGLIIYQSKNLFEIKNIPVFRADIGVGYQQIYLGFLALDISVGFAMSYTTSKNINSYSVSRSFRSVGNQWRWQTEDSRFNYGMRFILNLGFLLF